MKMIKKVTISIILSVLVVMFFMPPAVTFAFNDDLKSVYTVDGKRYIDINGETYQYLSLSDFTPVEDEELIALLENSSSGRSVYDPANLPVPPTYSKDLSKGAYTGTVDLTKGDQWSPIFKRDIQKRYTKISFNASDEKTRDDDLAHFFGQNDYKLKIHKNDYNEDYENFIGNQLSMSYSLKQSDDNYEEYVSEFQKLFNEYSNNNVIEIHNNTYCYIGNLIK